MAVTMSTEGISTDESGNISINGREAVNVYAFIALRGAVILRMKTGMSTLRKQEALMARNYGWSERKTFNGPKLLAELNAIGDAHGFERSKLDPTV